MVAVAIQPEFRNCIAAKERKERRDRSGGVISAEKTDHPSPFRSARLSLCSLRSLAANFGFQVQATVNNTRMATVAAGHCSNCLLGSPLIKQETT